MYLKVTKPFGKLKVGDFHETQTKEQGTTIIANGLAEEVDAKDFPDDKKADRPNAKDRSKNKK